MSEKTDEPLPQLFMFLPSINLSQIKQIDLPEGYSFRTFRDGDELYWEKIVVDSFEWDPKFVFMSEDPAFAKEKILFVTYDDIPIATAAAWNRPEYGEDCGYIHMVGCLREHTGKKIGYYLMVKVLEKFVSDGRICAILSTDDFRLPAIKTYLNLGFQIQMNHPSIPSRWENVIKTLSNNQ